jgi:hypothetical protein
MRDRLLRIIGWDLGISPDSAESQPYESPATKALRVRWKSTEVNTALRWLLKEAAHEADFSEASALEQVTPRLLRFCGALSGYLMVLEREIAMDRKSRTERDEAGGSIADALKELEVQCSRGLRPFITRYYSGVRTDELAKRFKRDLGDVATCWDRVCRLERKVFIPGVASQLGSGSAA